MLQDILSKTKYLFVLALMMVVPMQANAGLLGVEPIDQTDFGGNRLVYYYDLIDRDTYIQVTNTTTSFVTIHVQVFNASQDCEEVDFDVVLTPGDTNIYDMENLPTGSDLTGTSGFVVISAFTGPPFSIIGMFRVIDGQGFEYRTNAADSEFAGLFEIIPETPDYALNFNDIDGNNASDVVGIPYLAIDRRDVFASPAIGALFGVPGFPPLIFDENELPASCSPTVFACQEDGAFSFNKGIDNSLPQSHGFLPEICNTSRLTATNDAGWLYLPFIDFVCLEDFDPLGLICGDRDLESLDALTSTERQVVEVPTPDIRRRLELFFVGFLGLNNTNTTGSMDSWWGIPFFTGDNHEEPGEF